MPVKNKKPKTAAKAAAAKGSGQELHPAGAGQAAIWQEAGTFRNLMKYKCSDTCKKAGTVVRSQGLSIHIAKVR